MTLHATDFRHLDDYRVCLRSEQWQQQAFRQFAWRRFTS